jgi:hypothetical protein
MPKVQHVRVYYMYESCERHTYAVQLVNDEGFTMDPASYRTGSVYNNFEGLSREEARDRALIDAADWADFFDIEPKPFIEDGEIHTPSMTFDKYSDRRKSRKMREG